MNAWNYFNCISTSILNVASKGDILLFDAPTIEDRDKIYEDILVLHCFNMGCTGDAHPLLRSFLERNFAKKGKKGKKDRRSSGSFFTPVYIAEYIVKSTVSPLVYKILNSDASDKVSALSGLNICDPAMGAGVFLIAAHNFMCEAMHGVDSHYTDSEIALMASKTIYGVDINEDAVELSRLLLGLNIEKWKRLNQFDEYVKTAESNSI